MTYTACGLPEDVMDGSVETSTAMCTRDDCKIEAEHDQTVCTTQWYWG